MNELRLRNMEHRLWRTYKQDGLTDVLFGWLFLCAAVIGILDVRQAASWVRLALTVALPFLGVGFTFWMRKHFVIPRLGRVRFAARRVRQTRATAVFLAVYVLLTVVLVVLTALSDRLGLGFIGALGAVGVWGVIAAVILIPIGGIALALDYPRLLVYAALFLAVEYFHIVVRLPSRVEYGGVLAYAAAAMVSLAIGLCVYTRFLCRLSRPEAPRMEKDKGDERGIS
jgi:hypothetical protein